jgi:hypothetical protein
MPARTAISVSLFAIAMLTAGCQATGGGYLSKPELLDQIKPGVTTAQEVEQLLGTPLNRAHFPAVGRSSMDYEMQEWTDMFDVAVMIDDGGIVREVLKLKRHRTLQ